MLWIIRLCCTLWRFIVHIKELLVKLVFLCQFWYVNLHKVFALLLVGLLHLSNGTWFGRWQVAGGSITKTFAFSEIWDRVEGFYLCLHTSEGDYYGQLSCLSVPCPKMFLEYQELHTSQGSWQRQHLWPQNHIATPNTLNNNSGPDNSDQWS